MPDGTTCSDDINLHRYIQDYTCTNQMATDKYLREMRLSFPSGHASFGFYTMVFLAVSFWFRVLFILYFLVIHLIYGVFLQLYLQTRFSWKGSKLLKHVLQFTLITLAVFTALSRISDYKHHCKVLIMTLPQIPT